MSGSSPSTQKSYLTDSYMNSEMFVIKKNGKQEPVSFTKIVKRLKGINKDIKINYTDLTIKIMHQLHDKITTNQIDELCAEQCASLTSVHPDFHFLASHIIISNHHKKTLQSFVKTMNQLHQFRDSNGKKAPILSDSTIAVVKKHGELLEKTCDYQRDFLIDFFGFKTLEKSYLFRINQKVVERPQHMWMRVAIGIHGDNIDKILETYEYLSLKKMTHATPTLFNAGTPHMQLSSCFLLSMEEDSIEGIYNTLKDTALISKWSGGIGMHIHNIRGKGSQIRGTNGTSSGIVPMLRVFNNTAKYVDQAGRRNGSFAIYLEMWHPDIEMFLQMKKNHGDEELKARDLFYALWMCDLFMERVKDNAEWSLFCPDSCPGLADVYGQEFNELYLKYEAEGKEVRRVKARKIWFQILDSQMETGTPYMVYKDTVNTRSNQKNIGTIKSSNLCAEITLYSDREETSVCNLVSISLPSCVVEGAFDFVELGKIARMSTYNLNRVIDVNFYPTEKTRRSNLRHRPIGIGVQGLADVFFQMNIPFHSDRAKELNRDIFETIYYHALLESMELAKVEGPYETFEGSPASEGLLQFDLAGATVLDTRYDWTGLKEEIRVHGLRNSTLIALMPTASTSQILGNNECFEPITSNIYSRRTLAGEFMVVNKYMMKDLIELGIYSTELKNNIIANNGSIQHIDTIPVEIRNKYKTVWEIPMKHIIDMAAERSIFVDQSQSLNLWMEEPNYNTLTSMHFYAWERGLKTGIYYLRRRARHQAQQFTIVPECQEKVDMYELDKPVCSPATSTEDEICESCSA